MTSGKQRMAVAMRGGKPDRTPVMCQLAMGHIYRYFVRGAADFTPQAAFDFWFTSRGLAQAYIAAADAYRFDGILVSVTCGRDPALAATLESLVPADGGHQVTWTNGNVAFLPDDDNPRWIAPPRETPAMRQISDLDLGEITDRFHAPLPPYQLDIINAVMAARAPTLSIHGEVGTTFERFLRVCGGYEVGLMALRDDPDRCLEFMAVMNDLPIRQALAQCQAGVDAMKLSSPFAGAGFISRDDYRRFVLPFERQIIAAIHETAGIPCYIHTCGAIGDRLDLMLETGTDGLECLDPPPLGTVDLRQAVEQVGDRLFIKGNLDSVHELCRPLDEVKRIAAERIAVGSKARGYILSSACSVSPKAPRANIEALYHVACAS